MHRYIAEFVGGLGLYREDN